MTMLTRCALVVLFAGCDGYAPGVSGGGDDVPVNLDGGGTGSGDGGSATCDELPSDPFAPTVLEQGITYLASDALGGRLSGTEGDKATRAYIEQAFHCIGLVPGGTNGYQQQFTAPDGTVASNVIGYLKGTDPTLASKVIVIGAHHDHLGTKNGQVYNGANDNASGVISIIAVARALKAQPLKRTVAFIAFGYEEHDGNCEGSEYFAAHAPPELATNQTIYMLDLDMVGTYSLANEVTVYGASAGTRGRQVLDGLAPSYAGLTLTHSGNADTDDSDFQAFADRGIPYVYFETWDEACYHQPCDDTPRIDFPNMSRISKLMRDVLVALGNG